MAQSEAPPEADTEPEQVTYQFTMPRAPWREWTDTVPESETLEGRLHKLIAWDASSNPSVQLDADLAVFLLSMDRDAWNSWADSVPRSEPLDDRLRTLVVQDANSADVPDEEVAEYDARTAATRIRIKAAGALSAIRDRDDPEDAIEKLSTIHDIADALESS